jgi:hypothetical protein
MRWFGGGQRRLLELLASISQDRDTKVRENLKLAIELQLVKQAREKADHDATYWRERCERFLDQIALRAGMLSAPAMEAPTPSAPQDLGGVFAALNVGTINREPPPSGAAPTAPVLRDVDPAAATAAVEALLADIR